jgi:hypothetical protein
MQRLHTALLASATVLFAAQLASAQEFDGAGEQEMLTRINAMRAAQQLAPLTRSEALDGAARAHCADMFAARQLTHISQTTGTPADRVRRSGLAATTVAENVALHRTAGEAHEALLQSEAHRSNMMSADITHVGLGALRSEQGVYVTQVFAAVPPPAPAVQPVAPQPVVPQPAAPAVPPPAVVPQPIAPPPAPVIAPQPGSPIELVPGLRIEQGELPAPSQPPPAMAPAGQITFSIQEGSGGTVVVERTPDQRVNGYWVFASGRWWYYPMPAWARPGQRLVPDLNVTTPPPGFPVSMPGMQPAPQPQIARPQIVQPQIVRPQIVQPQIVQAMPQRSAQVVIQAQPGAAFYAVPPPPFVDTPDRAWRAAQRQWERAHRRWLRDQERMRRDAL